MKLEEIFFRFEKPREFQKDLVLDIAMALEQKKHLIAHAPTGLGKTDSALSPALSFALKEGKTIFFLTPKISQHEIAVQVLQELAKKFKLNFTGVDLIGRRYACSDPILSSASFDGFYEVCKKKRQREECQFFANSVGFTKKQKAISRIYFEELLRDYENIWAFPQLKNYCLNAKGKKGLRPLCAYEIALQLAKQSQIIIGDYFHLLNPNIQEIILGKTGKNLEDSIIIIDEAHNLPDRIRKLMSCTVSVFVLDKALSELKKMNLLELEEKIKSIEKALKQLAKKHLSIERHESLVGKTEFLDALKDSFAGEKEIIAFSGELRETAIDFMEATGKHKSNLIQIANFLDYWLKDLESHVRILKRSQTTDYSLSIKALDPSIVTKKIFEKAHSVILMSGTLLPTQMYADLLGMQPNRTLLREYSSPFPAHNRLNLVVPTSTTKFTERNFEEFNKIADQVASIVNLIPGNSAVFFPSFEILEQVFVFLSPQIKREILKQSPKMNAVDLSSLLKRFRNAGNAFGAVLLGATTGSLAEGLDYPGNQLLCVIVVGIPLQEMNLEVKCLIDFCQEKFGQGWHYGYLYPAISRAIQASGRVIRNEKDEGVTVFLDKRYTWDNYKNCFPKDFSKITTTEPEKYIKLFWEQGDSR